MDTSGVGFSVMVPSQSLSNIFFLNVFLISRLSLKYFSFSAVLDEQAYDLVLIDTSKLITDLISNT